MNDRTTRRRAAWCALTVTSILWVAGCSGSGGGTPSGSTTPAPSPESSVSGSALPGGTPSPTSSLTTPSADPSGTGASATVLASRDFTVTATYTPTRLHMRFDITELKRRGELLDLTAHLTNLEQDRSRDLRWQVGSRFQGPYRRDLTGTDGMFSGALLTDVAGKKRYLVAADSSNACVCTVQLSSTFIDGGQSVELTATYAAPPTSTTKLDVAVATLGTFRDLPVS